MAVTVRQLEDAELGDEELAEGIMNLRAAAYAYDDPQFRHPEHYSHVYRWLRAHPLGDEMRRWAVFDGDRVVGHVAALPQYYRLGGQRVVAYSPGDYMVHPDYGFHALSLMRKYFRTCENLVTCDMVPTVIQLERRMGAAEAGQMHYAAKLMNVSKLPSPPLPAPVERILNLVSHSVPLRGGPDNRSGRGSTESAPEPREQQAQRLRPRLPIPAPVKGLMNRGLAVADEVLGAAPEKGSRVEVVEEFDESFDELLETITRIVPCVAEKDATFLRWRYGPDSPQAPVTVLGVRREGKLLGYAALAVTSTREDGYILDLMVLPGHYEVARALLREAVRFFRRAGVQIIRYRFLQSSTSPRSRDLWRLGFFFRGSRGNTFLVKFSDQRLHQMALRLDNWSYSLGDGELTFWLR
jgi:hypothetical protein